MPNPELISLDHVPTSLSPHHAPHPTTDLHLPQRQKSSRHRDSPLGSPSPYWLPEVDRILGLLDPAASYPLCVQPHFPDHHHRHLLRQSLQSQTLHHLELTRPTLRIVCCWQ